MINNLIIIGHYEEIPMLFPCKSANEAVLTFIGILEFIYANMSINGPVPLCKSGKLLKQFICFENQGIKVYTLDLIRCPQRKSKHILAKAEYMPIGMTRLDGLIYSFSLSYMDKARALQEGRRILKEAGKCILVLHMPYSPLLGIASRRQLLLCLNLLNAIEEFFKLALEEDQPRFDVNIFINKIRDTIRMIISKEF